MGPNVLLLDTIWVLMDSYGFLVDTYWVLVDSYLVLVDSYWVRLGPSGLL